MPQFDSPWGATARLVLAGAWLGMAWFVVAGEPVARLAAAGMMFTILTCAAVVRYVDSRENSGGWW